MVPLSAVIQRYNAHWIVKENNERLKVLFLGNTDDGKSAIISVQGSHSQRENIQDCAG
jgi:hypothetical protein